jgi:hypothetical protein
MTTTTSIRHKGGCATCSSTPSAGCGCGMPSCSSCADQGFVRPRFFAGQLLTEDDLEALGGYVVGKNRLHNRMLFGDGVVCGLNVLCHPCGTGRVVVKPGYALDCCGNDIMVSCEQELDVLAMLRKLRDETLGDYACADPCLPGPASEGMEEDGGEQGSLRRKAAVSQDQAYEHGSPVPVERARYCLYVRYCESNGDLQSPYGAGSGCGPGACEPSRVREGFAFEVRCAKDEPRDDIVAAVLRCFGDILKLDRASADSARLQQDSKKLAEARAQIEKAPAVAFEPIHLARMRNAASAVRSWLERQDSPTSENLAEAAAEVGEYAGMVTRYVLHDSDATKTPRPEIGDEVEQAYVVLARASIELEERLQRVATGGTMLERAYVEGAVEMANAPDRHNHPFRRLWAEGVVYTARLESAYIAALESIQRTLLAHLEPGRPTADCRLRDDVASVRMPARSSGETGASADLERAVVTLVGALLRIVLDCICLAITPPCPSCDDPAVLIACLDVEDCKVVSVCNTSRKFVLTGHAMRYWLPPLGWLGDLLEVACCTLRKGISDAQSFRALAAWAGLRGGSNGYDVDLGPQHAFFAARSYYGPATPTDREIARLPSILASIGRAAAYRLDVPVSVAAPKPAATPTNFEINEQIKAEVGRAVTKELPRAVGTYLAPRVNDLVTAQLPTALEVALDEPRVATPVKSYLATHLAAEVRKAARTALEADLQNAFVTIANQRLGDLVKKHIEASAGPLVEATVKERAEAEVGARVAPEVRRVAAEEAATIVAPEVTRIAKELLDASLAARLDEVLEVKLATVLPAALRTSFAGGEVELVRELVASEVESRVKTVTEELDTFKVKVEEQRRSEASSRGAATKRIEDLTKKLAALEKRVGG